MTWAERVGDLATNVALVGINLARIFTLAASILATKVDDLVTSLGERSENGLARTDTAAGTWVRLPAAKVLWGIAAIGLRLISIVTVFVRQLSNAADDFFRTLAEG